MSHSAIVGATSAVLKTWASPASQELRLRETVRVSKTAISVGFLMAFPENLAGNKVAIPLGMSVKGKSPFRLRTEQLQERTFDWAARIIDLCPRRYPDDPSRTIWRQLIRAAPSASGNLEEADEAFTDDDFLYKMKVVLRETKESGRWLRFIARCKLAHHEKLGKLPNEAHELSKIFASIYMNRKRNIDAKKAARRT